MAEDTDTTKDRDRKRKRPFSVAQARRDLRAAERYLKTLEQQNVKGPELDKARKAVREARRDLEDMTSGSRGDRREARQEFMQDYYNELGGPWIAELVKRDKELRRIFEKAVRNDDLDGFMDDLYQSDWWNDPKKSGSWKAAFQLEFAKDKTSWRDAVEQAKRIISDTADQFYNMVIPDEILDQIARRFLYEGWDKNQNRGLRTWLSDQFETQSRDAESGLEPGGMYVDYARSLRNYARGYGLQRTDDWYERTAGLLLDPESGFTEDDIINEMIAEAESLYPSLQGKLSKDRTVRDVANGYLGWAAQILELDQDSIELTDPAIAAALGYGGADNAAMMPMWEYRKMLRRDSRWQSTDNARSTYSDLASTFLRSMGAVG